MNTTVKIAVIVMISFALALSSGCAKKGVYPGFFLGKYPHFSPGPEGGADLVYIKKDIDFSVYNKIMLEIQFYFDSGSKYNAIHPEVIAALTKDMYKAIADATGDTYPLVDQARPDVLRIRFAITDIVPHRIVSASGKKFGKGQEENFGKYVSVGGASMQAEILDSWTNERVGAVIDIKSVEKFKDYKSIDEWGNTKEAFKFWAERLRLFLDKAHGVK